MLSQLGWRFALGQEDVFQVNQTLSQQGWQIPKKVWLPEHQNLACLQGATSGGSWLPGLAPGKADFYVRTIVTNKCNNS